MTRLLSGVFSLRRRYSRSVHLERDLAAAGSVRGYIPMPRALSVLERFLDAYTTPRAVRAWTITGVYGTGKSAFGHFLASLLAPEDDPMRRDALQLLGTRADGKQLARRFREAIPATGLVRAVATARREPLAHTVVRALARGAEEFWRGRPGRKPAVLRELQNLRAELVHGSVLDGGRIISLVQELATASETGVVLLLDELGKNLEHAAQDATAGDVYLLQQLAELSETDSGAPVLVFGLLHQAFAEYGTGLAEVRRTEWQKIQGRFEDVAFTEPPEHMLRLIAHAIERRGSPEMEAIVRAGAEAWQAHFTGPDFDAYVGNVLTSDTIGAVFPLHPVSALVVPLLCAKYAQNDRSLFTFLTSHEPHAFARFLHERAQEGEFVPTQKVHELYDYFVDAAGPGLVFRPQFQRWAEVHGVILDAQGLDPDALAVLKTVGTLNLLAAGGPLRASRALVVAALCDRPDDQDAISHWEEVLAGLVARGLLTHRPRTDEYRVWEGSDFDIDAALAARMTAVPPLNELLAQVAPLAPLVAQRHSYRTGTLRYFERRYAGRIEELREAHAEKESDGLILYWTANQAPAEIPARTADGRPLVVVAATGLPRLGAAAAEFSALQTLVRTEPALQSDGVARKEVQHRLHFARAALRRALRSALDVGQLPCWIEGRPETLSGPEFNSRLSGLCDRIYKHGIVLWNELINRRELTSQGARARRELIEAMLQRGEQERLGLRGNGPEVSMYASVLEQSGIHRQEEAGRWGFGPPTHPNLQPAWKAIEDFCLSARTDPRGVDQLIEELASPPQGIKEGVIPLLLAAVLLYHSDDVSVYREGTFLPTLGAEHFELLVKHPGKFAVKSFALVGLRMEVFRELEQVLRKGPARPGLGERNRTILGIVRPLMRFIRALPPSTLKTTQLSGRALRVRDALHSACEPDALLFHELPRACDLPVFEPDAQPDAAVQAAFRDALVGALQELQSAYDRRLEECRKLVHTAFSIRSEIGRLREDLRVRATYLAGKVLERQLRAFVAAASSDVAEDREWLEALVMVVADKPMDVWTDDDAVGFEIRLSEIARRFSNLEAVQRDMGAADREGFEARRITITAPDGRDVHRLVWVDRAARGAVQRRVEDLQAQLRSLPDEQQFALVTALAEAVLQGRSQSPAADAEAEEPAQPMERQKHG